MTTSHPWSPPLTSTAIRINEKSACGTAPHCALEMDYVPTFTEMTWRPL
jgi:hypothetical protein